MLSLVQWCAEGVVLVLMLTSEQPFWSSSMAALMGGRWCQHSAAQTQLVPLLEALEAANLLARQQLGAIKLCYAGMLVSLL